MAVMTNDQRFMEACNSIGKEDANMCGVLDQIEKRGIEKGIEQGIKQGIEQGIEQEQKHIILNMHKEGCDAATISRLTTISIEIVGDILNKI